MVAPGALKNASRPDQNAEKMHRTAFATETRAKLLKYAIALHGTRQNRLAPAIVRTVLFILIKRDRFRSVRRGVNSHSSSRSLSVFIRSDKTRQLIALSGWSLRTMLLSMSSW